MFLGLLTAQVLAFSLGVTPTVSSAVTRQLSSVCMGVQPVDPSMLIVETDAAAVSATVLSKLNAAAAAAIAERGHFALAIPGGSVLNMLAGSAPAWAAQTTLAYVVSDVAYPLAPALRTGSRRVLQQTTLAYVASRVLPLPPPLTIAPPLPLTLAAA